MKNTIVIDDLVFELRRSARRRTVAIIIDREGTLIIAAPMRCPVEIMRRFVRDKRPWIDKKVAEREMLLRGKKNRKYVTGEEFGYLGRNHRLILLSSMDGQPPLRLYRGRFIMDRTEREKGREHFIRWYMDHAASWLGRRVDLYRNRIGVSVKEVRIREFRSRWGTCNPNGVISFDWRLILFPPEIIDYVVVHELVHLRVPRHNSKFWKLVEHIIPDFAERRKWLAKNGVSTDF